MNGKCCANIYYFTSSLNCTYNEYVVFSKWCLQWMYKQRYEWISVLSAGCWLVSREDRYARKRLYFFSWAVSTSLFSILRGSFSPKRLFVFQFEQAWSILCFDAEVRKVIVSCRVINDLLQHALDIFLFLFIASFGIYRSRFSHFYLTILLHGSIRPRHKLPSRLDSLGLPSQLQTPVPTRI